MRILPLPRLLIRCQAWNQSPGNWPFFLFHSFVFHCFHNDWNEPSDHVTVIERNAFVTQHRPHFAGSWVTVGGFFRELRALLFVWPQCKVQHETSSRARARLWASSRAGSGWGVL